MYCSISDIQQYSEDINRSNVFPFHVSMRGQLFLGLVNRPRLPGAERRGAGEAEGGVEGGAQEDRGGGPHPQAGPLRQGETRSGTEEEARNHGLEIGESSQKT